MTFDEKIINWLLEDDNPAIAYRTKTELLCQPACVVKAAEWINARLPAGWYETKGLWYRYYLTALAECGLCAKDVAPESFEKAFYELRNAFDAGCADFMLLRALVKLGLGEHPAVAAILSGLEGISLPDGGFLCLHRVNKLKYTPKSCYKANLQALMLFAECRKKGIACGAEKKLVGYFLNRNLFYKSTDLSALVLDGRGGWRTVDTFFPFEVMRVGLSNVVEALCALGCGGDAALAPAFEMLEKKRDSDGRYSLEGTLVKSYLPRERVGKPSKWVTFYVLLAQKECLDYAKKR